MSLHPLHRVFPNLRAGGWQCMYCGERKPKPEMLSPHCSTASESVLQGIVADHPDLAELFGFASGVQPPPPGR